MIQELVDAKPQLLDNVSLLDNLVTKQSRSSRDVLMYLQRRLARPVRSALPNAMGILGKQSPLYTMASVADDETGTDTTPLSTTREKHVGV